MSQDALAVQNASRRSAKARRDWTLNAVVLALFALFLWWGDGSMARALVGIGCPPNSTAIRYKFSTWWLCTAFWLYPST